LPRPVAKRTIRSNLRVNPELFTVPFRRRSRYHSYFSRGKPNSSILPFNTKKQGKSLPKMFPRKRASLLFIIGFGFSNAKRTKAGNLNRCWEIQLLIFQHNHNLLCIRVITMVDFLVNNLIKKSQQLKLHSLTSKMSC